ncbi:hypothetical protein PG994_001993 [Apiospora phragmitis]|uniref:Uncharacterized protein n=1 Tax=Apiospora phragmitis TaxID=2905665 RepID=A0ABR1WV52_9PEZI
MTTDRKEHPVEDPDLKLAIADLRCRSSDETHLTSNEASEDISPLSTAVVSRTDLSHVYNSKTASPPGWNQNKPSRANATRPDIHMIHAPFNPTTTTTGLIAEVRRAIREELSEAFRRGKGEADVTNLQPEGYLVPKPHLSGTSSSVSAKVKLNETSPGATTEWGDLFTSEGHATSRFGQIMRVLSGYIVSYLGPEQPQYFDP